MTAENAASGDEGAFCPSRALGRSGARDGTFEPRTRLRASRRAPRNNGPVTTRRPYIASVVTTLDQDTAYMKQSKTAQTLDAYGDVTQTKLYGYGSLTTPIRTYTNTYTHVVPLGFSRLDTSTVTDGTNQMTLVSNTYDFTVLTDVAGLRNHDPAYNTDYQARGNLTYQTANGISTTISYDITGTVTGADDGNGHSVSFTPAAGTNNAAPGVITPNSEANLAESLTYTSFLGVASDTHPNSATSTTDYDANGRPTSSTSPHGATTTYAYTNSPPTTTGHWVKTTMDGLGRTIKVETGDASGTKSIVETEYDSCACSPVGKVKRVSQPYAPGGTVYWTTYSYDCLGRTLSVTPPGNSGATIYVYQGNVVTVTDPAGKWKTYTSDALGNLVQVTEPDPTLGNVQTNYTYNMRNQLIGVSMPRGGTTQTRTFNYDLATGRLTSAANPENGTVSYTYNADGTVATRTDALSQQVRYTYDSHGRVSTVRRYNSSGVEQTCQKVTNTFDGSYNGWGRLSSVSWGGSSCTGGSWSQSYRYTSAGRPTRKTQTGGGFTLTANYTYDNEGKMLTAQYPSSGPTFTYTYDTMARPIKLTDNQATPVDWAKDVLYNAAGQITEMKYTQTTSGSSYYTETRTFNVLQQLTRLTVPGVLDHEYRFSDTQNDGRLTQRKDWISGEEVGYQYDSLNRLISASTTGPEWGQSFSYDGFGNMLAQTVTKGTAPTLSVLVDPATNRITTSGYGYDSNGNLTAMPLLTLSYDIENRLVQATSSLNGTEHYVYDPGNQRVWKEGKVYFYGVEGNLLGTYGDGSNTDYNVYFGGKLIWQEAAAGLAAHPVNADRLGSTVKHFPYGEEPTTTTQDRSKFATYYRDATTALDYAQNRYYARTIGRFTTTDPYGGSVDGKDPQSWNRYSYVQDDPVNHNDPTGNLLLEAPWDDWGGGGWGILPGGGWDWGSHWPWNPCGGGSEWLPNPYCYVPIVAILPTVVAVSEPTCAEVYGTPSDAAMKQIDVIMGEDSWPFREYSNSEVYSEELYMEQVMYNLSIENGYGATEAGIDKSINVVTYNGYDRGTAFRKAALKADWDSDLCNHLRSAWLAHDDFWNSPKNIFNLHHWATPEYYKKKYGEMKPGDIRMAGTVFYNYPPAPRSRPRRIPLPSPPGGNR